MNTSVNSETWISVGSRIPSTASAGAWVYMIAVNPSAPITRIAPCAALVVAAISAQVTNAPHISKPNHDPLSISAATIATAARMSATPRCGRKYFRSCSQEISVV
jgi:hypothetical protein